ncbi:heavy metal translocating P-type ATPase [Neisseriaceae bacterium TC5R-5]|nr:heavy metal translocating P-type ATPase [Neisseriaceae bacterium TC5R-5]
MNESCFHCGLPIPATADFPVRYREQAQATCCAGCQAVASTIIQSGLADYYQHRTAGARQAEPLPRELLEQIRLYDAEALQRSFVHIENEQVREASLMLEGITCAACVWLNEQHLSRLPGVLSVDIHYGSHRARVRWDTQRLRLSDILQAIHAIGYHAHPYDANRQEALQQRERKQTIKRLWVAGLSMMQVMMYAVPIYLDSAQEISADFLWLLHWASFILTLPVVLYSAVPFYRATWRDLKAHRVGMDTPISIGILTAFIASCWALLQRVEHGIYFDSVSMFVFLLLGGRYLESLAQRKAGAATESLIKLIPAFAHQLSDWPASHNSQQAAVTQLHKDDIILVKPGETIPVDGLVLAGNSASNEALLTGESRLLDKTEGDTVIAGSVNCTSPLVIRVERNGEDTRLASIVRLLDKALAEKPRLALLANHFASWFVTLLLLTAAATYLGWHYVDPDRALWVMVAVLVISCPCALSLATPTALTAAAGHLASLGILVTRGHALETLPKVSEVVFDKTGTLTYGELRLLDCLPMAVDDRSTVLQLAATLEQGSEHPLARALLAALPTDKMLPACSQLQSLPGQGLSGHIDGKPYWLGAPEFICQQLGLAQLPQPDWQADNTVIALANQQQLLALFAFGDAPRAEAAELIQQLKQQGLNVHLLSGDGDGAVSALAQRLAIPQQRARATPEDKLAYVSALQAQGKRVLMVGDGINDAPVLAKADVSLAMGAGTDVARASGDMILINNQLTLIAQAMKVARRTLHIIQQNLCWAAGYNLLALPLAISGHVTPWIASLGMATSSLLVVSNALRLLRRKS